MPAIALSKQPRSVLIIKPSAVGDVVHALPVLNLMRTAWPVARIDWLVTPACSGLLVGHPQLNDVILFDRKQLGTAWRNPTQFGRLFELGKRLRDAQYDVVVDLQGLFRSGWLSLQTRAPVRVGFSTAREMAPLFYTDTIDVGTTEQHAIDRYLTVADALGCGRSPVKFVFPEDEEDRAYVESLVPRDVKYAVLLPGTNWLTKRWPVESFAALVKPLKERFGLESIVAGGPGDKELARGVGGTDVTGKTSLRQLVELLKRADLVIGNDSGPTHIASALGRPLVTMYGPTNPVRTGPYQRLETVARLPLPCSPCYLKRCSHTSCMKWLSPEYVLRMAEAQVTANRPSSAGALSDQF